ncbi:hypothetical protein BGX28_000372 [Mortierella sp. GBA30]|nr:hypothetical protein BGX28_000372 [Mortierella sp. GBA30]
MSESRQELVAWVNGLLELNYTKIEQMGTGMGHDEYILQPFTEVFKRVFTVRPERDCQSHGAAYCQIMDSIYRDVPMNRVKFAAKQEYAYLENYKVLQSHFISHKIDKAIPTDRLMKCKMQDNLEFLQWVKRFWDANFPGDHYEAAARRGASNSPAPSASANRSTTTPVRRPVNNNGANRSMTGRGSALSAASTSSRASPDHLTVLNLQRELHEERTTVAALEKERDFYFGKLRDVEVLIQQDQDKNPGAVDNQLLKDIQAVLYSTEDGFEIPQDDQLLAEGEYPDETF